MTPDEANKIAVSITEKYYQPGSGVTYVEAISDALLKAAEAESIAGAEDMRERCLNEFSRWIRSSTATSFLDLVHSVRALTPLSPSPNPLAVEEARRRLEEHDKISLCSPKHPCLRRKKLAAALAKAEGKVTP